MKYGIHWFRRDLRVAGNPALEWNRETNKGRVLGIFVFDPSFLSRPDIGISRFGFLLKTLEALKLELQSLGGDLLVLDHGPEEAFTKLFKALSQENGPLPTHFTFNRDYEPFARERDARIESLVTDRFKISTHTERDHLLIEPHELYKDKPGSWYQVYSPFQKKWLANLQKKEFRDRLAPRAAERFHLTWKEVLSKALPKKLSDKFSDRLEAYLAKIIPECEVPLPPAGHAAALAQLDAFKDEWLGRYATERDFPAVNGTSQLSYYLKNGSISTAQIIHHLGIADKKHRDRSAATQDSKTKYLNELIWREFYYHILFHAPRVEHEAFNLKYKNIDWEDDRMLFLAWCEGRTGYPIIDAAMRQLNTTGWMHNRMRMVVASFLTKDLLINWQWGERYFMQKLLDGDLAANNGGWQWAASTGCDPQPYFRIFNPTLQGKRYDPDGDYVRKYVPELSQVDKKHIHEPWKLSKLPKGYPERVVDHSSRSLKAVSLFKRARTLESES